MSSRPDFLVLGYPVISFVAPYTHKGSLKNLLGDNPDPQLVKNLSSEFQVTGETPPTFLFTTSGDTAVPAENSIAFYLALHKAGVPAEMHVFEKGPHGVGLGGMDPALQEWPKASCAVVPLERLVEVRRGFLLLLAFALQGAVNQAQLDRIPVRMKAFADGQGTAAGFVTLVAVKGKVVQLSAVGYQDRETKIPMRVDSIFQVMSLTKAVTAASIMTLVDDGKISLIDPVEKYVPEFKGQLLRDGSKPTRAIQIVDLLSHTSGMASGFPGRVQRCGEEV